MCTKSQRILTKKIALANDKWKPEIDNKCDKPELRIAQSKFLEIFFCSPISNAKATLATSPLKLLRIFFRIISRKFKNHESIELIWFCKIICGFPIKNPKAWIFFTRAFNFKSKLSLKSGKSSGSRTALNLIISLILNFVDCLARFNEIFCGEFSRINSLFLAIQFWL